ncbi:MAG: HemK family protein methyltransferase [Candidatus Pacebacteria bacterium]|nr:HemK family protein methyltransferase [Candidatus Paceibacterota bacterium]
MKPSHSDMPVPYKKGFSKFLGLKIDLSQRPLIPRTETACWTKAAIKEIRKETKEKISCLDLFAGSGCIGLAVLAKTEKVSCDFGDVSPENIKQIKVNIGLNGLKKREAKIILTDVFSNVKKKYDYILANPPYIAGVRFHLVQPSSLAFEPRIALDGKKDGMFYIDKFLKDAKNFLKPGGKIFMEFDFYQKKELEKSLKKYGWKDYKIYKDQFGKERFVKITS